MCHACRALGHFTQYSVSPCPDPLVLARDIALFAQAEKSAEVSLCRSQHRKDLRAWKRIQYVADFVQV